MLIEMEVCCGLIMLTFSVVNVVSVLPTCFKGNYFYVFSKANFKYFEIIVCYTL